MSLAQGWTASNQTTPNEVHETGGNDYRISHSVLTEGPTVAVSNSEDDGNLETIRDVVTPEKVHSTSHSTSASPGSTSPKDKDPPTRRPNADPSRVRKHNQRIFFYDYDALRMYGLIFSAVLFTLGILILTCGRCKNSISCGRKERRKYNVRQL
ncbi:FXYD domain-containing ion transport regulator 5 isoform X1 [Microcaecilia unicolor]|uniref:FXYD domain-containing ion transport regulator n=1 Tax=Microcaecilia unicolor TaxID=1415580 RepID=A0A6P7YS41_9AMPH|nr:FXYD domain-containing ion transport regulator 5-like isoform X1 [Microcaecilia unicolor]